MNKQSFIITAFVFKEILCKFTNIACISKDVKFCLKLSVNEQSIINKEMIKQKANTEPAYQLVRIQVHLLF